MTTLTRPESAPRSRLAPLRRALPWLKPRTFLNRLREDALERLLRTRAGPGLYYGLISDAFGREHRAVAAGRRLYADALGARRRSSFRLRRNTHRLEKGLVASDRRRVFALDFIAETVADFEAVSAAHAPDEPPSAELKWARDVLEAYFDAVDADHPVLAPLRARFARAAAGRPAGEGPTSAPFLRDLEAAGPASVEALQALAVRRRSVRGYRPEPVPRALVDRAVAIAGQSPSACNRQPFSFLIFDDPAEARKVAAVPAGTKSFGHEVPAIVVVVGRLRAYSGERDRHAPFVDASLAAMAFMLGLEAQGVGSCAINWGDEAPRERRIARMLDLAPDERVILMISYGWPDPQARVPWSAKRPLEELREYGRPLREG